jgi:hypothetical protein
MAKRKMANVPRSDDVAVVDDDVDAKPTSPKPLKKSSPKQRTSNNSTSLKRLTPKTVTPKTAIPRTTTKIGPRSDDVAVAENHVATKSLLNRATTKATKRLRKPTTAMTKMKSGDHLNDENAVASANRRTTIRK